MSVQHKLQGDVVIIKENSYPFTTHIKRLTMLFHTATAMSACPRSLKWKQSWEKYVTSGWPSCTRENTQSSLFVGKMHPEH